MVIGLADGPRLDVGPAFDVSSPAPHSSAGQVSRTLALRWGNEDFARPEPWDELVYVAANHDNDWAEVRSLRSGCCAVHGAGRRARRGRWVAERTFAHNAVFCRALAASRVVGVEFGVGCAVTSSVAQK